MCLTLRGEGTDRFTLSIVQYQFPDLDHQEATYDDDCDWLDMHIQVIRGDQMWEFIDPCLQVGEFALLANWIRTAANAQNESQAVFLENTFWIVKETFLNEPALIVYFAEPHPRMYEMVTWPPWVDRSAIQDTDYRIVCPVRLNDLHVVADAIEEQLRQFPSRRCVM
jgi:hypothetical protein